MAFVYVHIIWFAVWIGLARRALPVRAVDDDRVSGGDLLVDVRSDQPEPADAKRQVVADQQWQTVQEEDQQNRELLDLSNQILDLTKAVHAYVHAAAELRPAGGERRDATGRQS